MPNRRHFTVHNKVPIEITGDTTVKSLSQFMTESEAHEVYKKNVHIIKNKQFIVDTSKDK